MGVLIGARMGEGGAGANGKFNGFGRPCNYEVRKPARSKQSEAREAFRQARTKTYATEENVAQQCYAPLIRALR